MSSTMTASISEVVVAAPVKRRRTPALVGALVGVALLGAGTWWLTHRHEESTDDAQVEGRVISVSARVAGQVVKVHVLDNQTVEAGDVLVELDPADYVAKVDGARADLAAARATARASHATLSLVQRTAPAGASSARGSLQAASSSDGAARSNLERARAAVSAAEARRRLAELELNRSKELVASKVISDAELDARKATFDTSDADLLAAKAQLRTASAVIDGAAGDVQAARGKLAAADTENEQLESAQAAVDLAESRVAQAEAALKIAELNASYTTVRAQRRGVISRRSVEAGQFVSPDRPLFAIVPTDDVWVIANFKEDQLGDMTVGNVATVEVDTYSHKHFRARIDSIAGGTGARFALLPPDNATGNFVKVVQRVPVLLRLEDAPSGLTLRPGMSAYVTVDTRGR